MTHKTALSLLAAFAILLTAANTDAADKISVGDRAPKIGKLTGVDGKQHSLPSNKATKVTIVCFTCNHCPIAVEYEDRFVEFNKKYKDKGVSFLAINVNGESLEEMQARAEEKGLNYPYLIDPSQKIGLAYGAKVTPHMFVLDKNKQVAYIGSFDDNLLEAKVKKTYVVDAVEALLSGKKPELTKTRPFGCGILYR